MNRGIDLKLEAEHRKPEDWIFGATGPGSTPKCVALVPENMRETYLPEGERQAGLEDFQDCVTRGALNLLEMKFNRFFSLTMSDENSKWLVDNGYVENGRINFADRFIAILSGTTRTGNSLIAPLEAVHKYGLIPKKLLPASPDMTWDLYHNKSDITPAMYTLGQEFLKRFTINYDRVYQKDFDTVLKEDAILVALYAWPEPKNGVYPRVADDFTHAVMNYKLKYFIFDNYEEGKNDWIKNLAPDYRFFDYGYRIVISAEHSAQEYEQTRMTFIGLLQKALEIAKQILGLKQQELVELKKKDMPTPEIKKPTLEDMALAIKKHEGWFIGSRSWRNQNPGNLRWSPFMLRKEAGFAYFKDYATGWKALMYQLQIARNGDSKVYTPEDTLKEFFAKYAPSSDNNDPDAYAKAVAKQIGVDVNYKLKDFLV